MNPATAIFTATPGPRTLVERIRNVFRGEADAVYACDLRDAIAYIKHLEAVATSPKTREDYRAFRMVAAPTPTTEQMEEILEDLAARGLATVRRQPNGKNRYYALPDVGN